MLSVLTKTILNSIARENSTSVPMSGAAAALARTGALVHSRRLQAILSIRRPKMKVRSNPVVPKGTDHATR